jgi:hypothetical protein
MATNDMMWCVARKQNLFFCIKTKSIEKIKKSQMFFWSRNKFQLFLKPEILIQADIK